ncbi:acyl-CoA dehydrogenase family protein [Ralstonia solanacearum]|uniref:acyl-CoA dehydrogenase family protein n=1 Tax=Ralstonia solanacearum TaxID=305 RepID=UPI003CC8C651
MKLDDLHQLPDLSALPEALAATAAQRDRQGGHPAHEKALIARLGLLPQVIPTQYGGAGAGWADAFAAVRAIAAVDSALGHLLAFQYLQTATVYLYGSDAQRERFLRPTAELGWWWGNAVNPLDHRLRAQRSGSGWIIDGEKGFCSGTLGSDMMVLSAHDAQSGRPVVAVVPTARYGIAVRDDWYPIGQRQTDSATVQFRHVQVSEDEVLAGPDAALSPYQSLRTCIAQNVLVHLYTGLAAGALDEARRHTLQASRPWFTSGVERAADDPYQIQRFGEMRVQWLAAETLAERAVQRSTVRGARARRSPPTSAPRSRSPRRRPRCWRIARRCSSGRSCSRPPARARPRRHWRSTVSGATRARIRCTIRWTTSCVPSAAMRWRASCPTRRSTVERVSRAMCPSRA